MNIERSSAVTVSARELVAALKVAHPDNLDIQAIPASNMGVSMVADKGAVTFITTRSVSTVTALATRG